MKTIERFYNSFDLEKIKLTKRFQDYLSLEEGKIKNTIKAGRVLDVGCGEGRIVNLIIGQVEKIYGIDISKKSLNRVKGKYSKEKRINLFHENSTDTHFENNYFDWIVLGWNTLGNLGEDLVPTIKEMKRVLNPRGKIILSVFSEKVLPEYMKLLEINNLKIQRISNDRVILANGLISKRFSMTELKKIFNNQNLQVKITKIAKLFYWCEVKYEK